MAAARPQMTEGAGGVTGAGGADVPLPFQRAVEALNDARTRPEVELSSMPAPKRLAPFAYALEATVTAPPAGPPGPGGDGADEADEPEELAEGRFVLLHDPEGQEAWQGAFRIVTLARADLEPELATDPLLPEVTWSWLTGALESHGLTCGAPSGTVTRSGSYFFGGLADRTPRTELEIRASWTPLGGGQGGGPADRLPDAPAGPEAPQVPYAAAHLAAWCELLCQCAGLPPESAETAARGEAGGAGGAVVQLPQRRGPQSR